TSSLVPSGRRMREPTWPPRPETSTEPPFRCRPMGRRAGRRQLFFKRLKSLLKFFGYQEFSSQTELLTPRTTRHYGSPRATPKTAILPLSRRGSEPGRNMAFALSAEDEKKFSEILSRYPNKMAACIPVLHLCQEANENWVSDDVIAF